MAEFSLASGALHLAWIGKFRLLVRRPTDTGAVAVSIEMQNCMKLPSIECGNRVVHPSLRRLLGQWVLDAVRPVLLLKRSQNQFLVGSRILKFLDKQTPPVQVTQRIVPYWLGGEW